MISLSELETWVAKIRAYDPECKFDGINLVLNFYGVRVGVHIQANHRFVYCGPTETESYSDKDRVISQYFLRHSPGWYGIYETSVSETLEDILGMLEKQIPYEDMLKWAVATLSSSQRDAIEQDPVTHSLMTDSNYYYFYELPFIREYARSLI